MSKYYYINHPESLGGDLVLISDNGWQFPPDESNPNYQAYLVWLAEGNEPEPWEPEQ